MKNTLARATLLSFVLFLAVPVRAEEPSLLHSAPTRAEPKLPLRLDGTLVEGGRILEMYVRYRGPGEPFARVLMERQYGDLYRGVIPAEHMVPPGVEYYVEGLTADGERIPIFQTAARPARVFVAGDVSATASRPATPEPASSNSADERPSTRTPPPERTRTPPPTSSTSDDDSMAALTADLPSDVPPPKVSSRDTRTPSTSREPPPPTRGSATTSREPTRGTREAPPRESGTSRDATARETGTSRDATAREAGTSRDAPTREAGTSRDAPIREPVASRDSSRESSTRDTSSSRESSSPRESAVVAPPRSELEEDMALYSAEDTLALATRHEEKVRKVPAIAASFGREQISALGARTVADVLDVVPGLTISRDVQGFHRTAVRGLRNDAEVLFLLNGHRLNNFFDGKALMNLPVENLERIEVIRGPGSALYGAGAFLGVVNIVTDTSDGVRTAVSAGGFPEKDDRLAITVNGHASAGETFGDLRLFADADVWNQTGDSNVIEHDGLDDESTSQGLRAVEDPAGKTRDDRFLLNLGGGATYAMGDAGRLGASVRFLTENRTALMGLFDTVGEDSELKWNVLMADLQWERAIGSSVLLRARAGFDQQSTDRLFQITPLNFRTGPDANQLFDKGLRERTRISVRSITGGVDADISLSANNRLSLGAVVEQQSLGDYDYETNYTLDARVRPEGFTAPEGLTDLLGLADGAASRRLIVGFFAQDQWTVIAPLTLTFGVRVDATQLPTVDGSGTITGTSFVPSINPRVGLVFSATDALVLKALYGRAFRAPTLQELVERIPDTTYNQGRFEGNPRLQPSTVDTFELGADLIQSAGEARVRLRANAYLELFDSPIIPVDTSGNIVPLRNRELGVRVYGIEGEARLEASKRANAWFNASISRAQDMELPSQSRLLTDTPQARFNAGVSMPIGAWVNFDVVVRTGAERRNNSRSVLELVRRYKIPAYSLITAQIRSEPIADIWEVSLVAHNVFDHDLRDDVPRPDRVTGSLPREGMSGYLTVRAHF
ncbi:MULTISPECIES: TonB-dependent siderophore receptor [Myxococcus]|uniref:TonB-dependent receptor n=1 Tax=Myxococcus llanfairpwllgwyngyllgogerychwyrndrobwllllantysiliogogogochensis TaxID=2590453 RepID=A0A540WRH1_9BACT|nr:MULTISPECIES: TonB-dependent receptor [Myxococcus]NTX02012.1 TonB-dependent receptor [Myxococcus sp. CA040A]TQF11621.1 TonB-dependent receptor [Myxococcus llanfairpwllgwyngyllgogerychwyrndrobwllllantysiliogogogochensis]